MFWWTKWRLRNFGGPEARSRAAIKLGESKDPRAVEPLIATLGDEADEVQKAAAAALGKIGDVRAIGPLVARLKTASFAVRQCMVDALGKIDTNWKKSTAAQAAVPDLVSELQNGGWHERQAAAAVLGHFENEQAVEPLLAALLDHSDAKSEDLRGAAADALDKIRRDWRSSEAVLAKVPELLALLDSEGTAPAEREAAADLLGRIGDPGFVESLISVLNNKNDLANSVGWAAALALGRIGDHRAIEPLKAALQWLEQRTQTGASLFFGAAARAGQENPAVGEMEKAAPAVPILASGWLGREKVKTALDMILKSMESKPSPQVDLEDAMELFGKKTDEPRAPESADSQEAPVPALGSVSSREDYLRMSQEERNQFASRFHSMLESKFRDTDFGYQSFPDLRYDEMVFSTLFSDMLQSGQIVSAGRERFRLAPKVVRTSRKKVVRPDYPSYMLPTIPPQGRSFEVDEDCLMVSIGEYDCPVCHENLGDLVPSHGANVVIRFHRAHGVHFWWSILPHCGKKLLISNSGM